MSAPMLCSPSLAAGATNAGDGAFDKLRSNGKATEQNKFAFDGIDAAGVFDAALVG